VKTKDRISNIPMVCVNLGLYDEEIDAKEKCKELNSSLKEKIFAVKRITYNM
jgi:hypothetical protein